jgi:DNA primase
MEITRIKQQLSLKTVLDYYSLKPDKNLRLHCPFHADKTPSLQVYYKTHTAYCFSSNCKTHGKSMDVIEFILHKESCTKHEAIQKAKQLIGATEIQATASTEKNYPLPNKLSISKEQFLQNIFTYFKNGVHNSKPAQEYIRSRNLDFTKLEIGYNTGQFHHGARKEETLINQCLQYGLLTNHDRLSKMGEICYKSFAKFCIVFGLRNQSNQLTGLYFRSTINDKDQKHFYLKESTGLYPGYPKEETQKLIITESIIDAASLLQIKAITDQYGIIAAYGTNRLNEEMKAAIAEWSKNPPLEGREVVFAFDNDEAGNKAVKKYAEELKQLLPDIIISKIVLPCKDVNETLQVHSDENIFIDLLNGRTTDFILSEAEGSTENTNQPGAKLLIEKSVERERTVEIIQQHPTHELNTKNPYKLIYTSDTAVYYIQGGLPKTTDHLKVMLVIEHPQTNFKARNKIDLYEDKQVEKLCKEVAEKLQLRKDLLEADLYRLTDLLESHIEKKLQVKEESGEQPQIILTVKERTELTAFASKPKLIKRLNDMLGKAGIVGEERNRVLLLCIGVSYMLPETLHALIQGSSGSGKTRLMKQVIYCLPKYKVNTYTRITDKVLYNYPTNFFCNTLLCIEDVDGLSEEALFAWRELSSNGELNSAASQKLDNGQIVAAEKTVKGPIASMACTTQGSIYEDNMGRVFLIAVDESIEQTRKIIQYQNNKAAGLTDAKAEQETKSFLQKLFTLLQPFEVINPYGNEIMLPEEAHKIRRLNEMYQGLVKVITVINQYQRKKNAQNKLLTEIEDIEMAVHIMFESIVLKVDELDGSLRHFYEKLKNFVLKKGKSYEFTRFEVREATGIGKTQQHYYINQLVNLCYVQQLGFANRGFTYKIVYWDDYEAFRERIKKNLLTQIEILKQKPS